MTKNNLINKTGREFRAFCTFVLKEKTSDDGESQYYVNGVLAFMNMKALNSTNR